MVVAVLAATCAACGYALAGRGNALPANIVTIGIPPFENQSTTADIDLVLTDAVRAEFADQGQVPDHPGTVGADAVLTGTVTSVTLQPVAFTADNQVSRNQIVATASVVFRDVTTGRTIWANPSFRVRDEYEVTTGTSANDPAALFSQDTNALDRLSQTFARSVVTSIFEAF